MTEQQRQEANEEVADLSLPNLMTMCYKQLTKPQNLERIANDERHVRVLTFRMLYENNNAIKSFNIISTLLSCVILALVIVQVVLAICE